MFDNAQFEKGVASTLASLKGLEQGLALKDGVSGIEKVQAAAEKLSFSNAEHEVSGLASALGGLKDTATNVFDHITSGIGTLAKGYALVKGIFSAGIGAMAIQGGWTRASNINKAAFKLDSMGVGWKNVSDSVSQAVDGTAYSLDAAATSAALFASSGVKAGDDMTRALKATANLASISGASFEHIGDIMAKVAAQGKLTGMQIDSFMFAGIDVAGILKSELNLTQEGFDKLKKEGISLSDWVDVVMNKFGDAAALANNSFDGALGNMRSALSRTFADLFQYGQMGMIPIFNGVRESINMVNNALNPLMRTWKEFNKETGLEELKKGVLIRGFEDFGKHVGDALHMWGGTKTVMKKVLNEETGEWEKKKTTVYIEKTNERFKRIFQMLSDGLEGPISEFNAGVYDLVHGLLDLGSVGREAFRLLLESLTPIGSAMQDVFGNGAFADATHRFFKGVWVILENLADLHISTGFANQLRAVFQVLFGMLKGAGGAVFNAVGGAVIGLSEAFRAAWSMGGHLVDMFDMMRRAGVDVFTALGISLSPLKEMTKDIPVIGSLVKILVSIPKGLGLLYDAMQGKEGSFEKLATFITKRAKNLGKIGKDIGGGFIAIGSGLRNFAQTVRDKAAQWIPALFESLKDTGEKLLPVLGLIPSALGSLLGAIRDAAKESGLLDLLSPWEDFLDVFSTSMDLFSNGTLLEKGNFKLLGERIWGALTTALGQTKDKFVSFFSTLFSNVFNSLPVPVQNFAKKLSGVFGVVKGIFEGVLDHVLAVKDGLLEAFQNADFDGSVFLDFFKGIAKAFGDFLGGEGSKFDFGALFEGIKNAAGKLIEDVGPKFETFTKGIKDSIYNNLSPAFQDIYDKIQDIAAPFENLGGIIEKVGENFGKVTLPDIFSKNPFEKESFIGPVLKTDEAKINKFGGEAFDLIQAIENIGNLIWSPLGTMKSIFSSGLQGFGMAFKDFVDSLPEEEIRKFVGFISTIGIDAGVVVGLFNMSRAVGAVAGVAESVKNAIGKLAGVFGEMKSAVSQVGTMIHMHTVMELAISVGILAATLIALTFIDVNKLWDVVPVLAVLSAIMLAMTGFVGVMSGLGGGFGKMWKITEGFNFEGIAKIAAAMIPMAISVSILAGVIGKLASLDPEGLQRGGFALGQIMLTLAGLAFVIGKFSGPSFAKAASSMLSMALGVFVMYGAIKLLSGMDDTVFTQGYNRVFIISGIFIAFAALTALASSVGGGGASFKGLSVAMLALTASIFAFIKFIEILSPIKVGDIAKGLVTVLLIEGLMIGLIYAISYMQKMGKMGRGIRQAVPVLLSMAVVIGVLGGVIAALAFVSSLGGNIWSATGAMFVGLIGLSAVIVALGKSSHISANISVALFSMAIAIGVFAGAVLLLSQVPLEMVAMGLLAMAGILLVFGVAMRAFGAIGKSFGAGLIQFGAALLSFNLAALALAGSMFVAVAALTMFAAAEPTITASLQSFFKAMSQLFSDAEFTKGVLWATLAMTAAGAAAIILGAGLGVLAAAMFLLPPITKESAESMLGFFNTFTEHKDEFVEGIKNFILAGIDGIGAAAATVNERFVQFITELANKPAENPAPMIAAGAKIVGHLLQGLLSALGSLGAWIVNALGDAIFAPLNEALESGLESIGWGINDFFFNTFGVGIDPATRGFGEHLKSGMSDGIDSANTVVVGKVDELLANTVSKLEETAGVAEEEGKKVPEAYASSLSEGKIDLFSLVGLDDATLSGGFDSVKQFFASKGIELPDELITQFTSGASGFDAWSMIQQNGNVDLSQFTELMGEGGIAGADAFTGQFDERMNDVDIMSIVANAADIDVETLKENFSGAAAAAATAFSEGFAENMKLDGSGPMEKAAASLRGSAGSMKNAGEALGTATNDGFKKTTKKMSGTAKDATKDAVAAVTSQKPAASSGGHDVGYNLGAGLKNGLNDGSNGLASRAAQIVKDAIASMKKAANEKSPSRETIWISEMMMRGLMVGFANLRGDVITSAESVMKDSLSAMADASYIAGLLDDIDDQPTIRPVLDLTDYEAGINRMKGLNASAPMNSAQLANRMASTAVSSGYYNNSNRTIAINLNYGAGTTAAQMVNEMAMILQTKNLMEA